MHEPGVIALGSRDRRSGQLWSAGDIGKASRRHGNIPEPFAFLALFFLLQLPLALRGDAPLAFELFSQSISNLSRVGR
jgi:hypothetical protein